MAGQITAAQLTAALAGVGRLPTALRLPELLANTFGHLSARDGWQAAAVCKAWRGPWRQRLKGMLRCVRRGAPLPKYNERVSAGAGGVLVADYNHGWVWCCGSGWGYPQESALGHRTQWCVHIFAICD